MVKINLKALQNANENTQTEEKVENIVAVKESSEIKKVEEVDVKPKMKISLKDLNIVSSEKKEENITQDISKTKVIKNDWVKQEEKIEDKKEENSTNKPIINELKKEEKIEDKKVETFSISDWDTNCAIIQDKKVEIFSNYKWSYAPKPKEEEKKEVKEVMKEKTEVKEIIEEKIEDTSKNEIIETKSEEKQLIEISKDENTNSYSQEESQQITNNRNTDNSKTNLEKFKEWSKQKIQFKNLLKNKKVLIWALASLIITLSVWLFTWLNHFSNPPIKSNINEIPQDKQKNDLINKEQKENIVKENIPASVDNNKKTDNIRNDVENYLIKKYKTN